MRLKTPIITLTLLALAACGSSTGEKKVPDNQAIRPQAGDSSWQTTSVDGVDVTLPGELEKKGPLSPGDDAVLFTFQTKTNSFGTKGGVQVVTVPKRKKSAANVADTVITQVKATIGAKESRKVHVVWPGAEDAWFVTYVAQVPFGGQTAPHPAEVLIVDLPGGGQSQATVTALDHDFSSLEMHKILETVKITEDAGAGKS